MSRQQSGWAIALGLSCQQAASPVAVSPSAAVAPSAAVEHAASAEGVETRGLAPGGALPGVTSECGAYATLEWGSRQLMNNVFAREQARGPWEQCLLRRQTSGKEQLGWSWSWPGFLASSFGFPEIIIGWKPWSAHSTDQRLPVRLADVQRLDVKYAVQVESSSKQSLALAAWLTSSGEVTSNPLSIRTEVVVWLDHTAELSPAGQRIETVSLNDLSYELWHEAQHGDRGDGSGWDLYYFQPSVRRSSGTVPLLPFLQHLRQKGRVRAEHFVASVELGNELMGGSGTTWIEEYEVLLTAVRAAP